MLSPCNSTPPTISLSRVDPTKIEKLKDVKDRFRALTAKEREGLSIALLKVNLGVNSPDDMRHVQAFLDGLPMDLGVGKLDPFMNFLHSTSNISPPEFSGWFARDEVKKDLSVTEKKIDLPPYVEDDVETLRDEVHPFGRGRRS